MPQITWNGNEIIKNVLDLWPPKKNEKRKEKKRKEKKTKRKETKKRNKIST